MLLCVLALLFFEDRKSLKVSLFVSSGRRMKSRPHALLPATGRRLFFSKLNKRMSQGFAAREPRFPVEERDDDGGERAQQDYERQLDQLLYHADDFICLFAPTRINHLNDRL